VLCLTNQANELFVQSIGVSALQLSSTSLLLVLIKPARIMLMPSTLQFDW